MNKSKQRNDPYIRSLIGQELLSFVTEHPDKSWDWYGISSNPFNKMYDNIEERYSSRSIAF